MKNSSTTSTPTHAPPGKQLSARDQRTYLVSDERLQAFGQLSVLQRLQWVEQCSSFVRLAQAAKRTKSEAPAGH